MKKQTWLVLGGVIFLVCWAGTGRVASSGAPIGSTGAPGENTCAKSGCHTGQDNLNAGPGTLRLNHDLAGLSYEPGQVYSLSVSLEQKDIERFGFALSVLNKEGKSVGEFILTEPSRTQVLPGISHFSGRNYLTYTYAGTQALPDETGKWSFQWKAPETEQGSVTFYFAAVAANNDGTDEGDQVYTDSLKVDLLMSSDILKNGIRAEVFPNPVKTDFQLHFDLKTAGNTEISLIDLNGAQQIIRTGWLASGPQSVILKKPATPGVYLLRISQGAQGFSTKLKVE